MLQALMLMNRLTSIRDIHIHIMDGVLIVMLILKMPEYINHLNIPMHLIIYMNASAMATVIEYKMDMLL
jgi:hypothetical protein